MKLSAQNSTRGQFVMTGTDMGSCAGVVPTYFASSMSATYYITYCRLQLQ